MRIHVVLDDELFASALKASGLKTEKAVIEEGLKLLIQLEKQAEFKNYRGKLIWDDDLDRMRIDK
jgi:Arc/MetJ family transcription regulator